MLNSEKFKSAEERRVAYADYCEECGKKHMALTDEFGWLDLEFEYKEGVKSCPFCGDESVNIFKSFDRDIWYVSCNKCGVRTEGDTNEELAIATWNRRVNQKPQDKTADTPSKKQAKIIFYADDQSTTCHIEDENGRAESNNPYEHIIEEKKKNGDYYGLSPTEYKKLLEKDGYEWVVISHNGWLGSEVWSKSDGYVFKGKYKDLKVGDKYYNGSDTIQIKK